MNNIAPLSDNQKAYLARVGGSWFNVAEGGKRGGKNVLNTLAYCLAIENHPDRLHLIAGVSQSTASINILDCDGYGLLNYFEGRSRKGKYEDKKCVYLNTLAGEKVILVAGGGKNGDERYIKGNTYGTAYITEANECAESFIKEAFDRTLSSNDRKIFHDLNPKPPTHWYYSEVLDFHEREQAKNKDYGYNYGHFTIADNLSISDTKLRKILTTYEKGTVWYDRDIKGLRVTANGIVFRNFAEHTQSYMIHKEELPEGFEWVSVGFDIGGNGSAYAMTCAAQGYDGIVYVLSSCKKQAKGLPMEEVEQFVYKFIDDVEEKYKTQVEDVSCDHSDVIINTLNRDRYIFRKAYKPPLKDRPFLFSALMAQGRLKLVEGECEDLVCELQNLVYDPKAEEPIVLDDGSMQIDTWDSLTYALSGRWIKDRNKRYKILLKWLMHALIMGVIGYVYNKEVDEEGYKNLSSYKKNNFYNFAIGDGKFISLPKPRENALLDTFTERTIEYLAGENKDAFYDFGNYLTSQLLPPMLPDTLNPVDAAHSAFGSTVLGGLVDVGFNQDFKGAPIESAYDNNVPSNERYTENTSKIAYGLGQTKLARDSDMSPKKIDHLISSCTGIFGQANKALFPINDSRRDWSIGLRNKFISDSNYSTDVLNRMYENQEKAEKAFNYKGTINAAVEYEKNSVITSYISGMNKAIKALPDEEQRKGRAYLLKSLSSWNYDNTASQEYMLKSLKSESNLKDCIITSVPKSALEWTEDKIKYTYQMTPQEYNEYVEDYLRLVEKYRAYQSKHTRKAADYVSALNDTNKEVKKKLSEKYQKRYKGKAEKNHKK